MNYVINHYSEYSDSFCKKLNQIENNENVDYDEVLMANSEVNETEH